MLVGFGVIVKDSVGILFLFMMVVVRCVLLWLVMVGSMVGLVMVKSGFLVCDFRLMFSFCWLLILEVSVCVIWFSRLWVFCRWVFW